MVSRYDAVLILLPVLAVSGLVVREATKVIQPLVGVGTGILELPLLAFGLIAAMTLICHEVFLSPPLENV